MSDETEWLVRRGRNLGTAKDDSVASSSRASVVADAAFSHANRRIALSGFFGATAVLAGAFGAHALRGHLMPEMLAVWNTGAQYQLAHAVALLALALASRSEPRVKIPFLLLASGTALFSGSLYALALSGTRWLGAITPVGGVLMVAGWMALAWVFRNGATGAKPPA